MIDLSKSRDFFDPTLVTERVHIIGTGSVGGFVAELLARFGITKFALYDFDTVERKNVSNQIFTSNDVGKMKVLVVNDILQAINPEVDVDIYTEGYIDQPLSGYVFLCVDSIELRKKIVKENMYNTLIRGMFDFRTRLTDSQHYAADWGNVASKYNFFKTMDFSAEEAAAETPVSACGVTLCVAPTVRMVSELGVMNFVQFVKTGNIRHFINVDVLNMNIEAYPKGF